MGHNRSVMWLCVAWAGLVSGCGWWGGDEEKGFEDELPKLEIAVDETEPTTDDHAEAASLSPATQIPLRKTVVQSLIQGSVSSRCKLVLELVISIEEAAVEGRTRLGVYYNRVRLSGNVAGEEFDYNSQNPPKTIPSQALIYHGLVGNSFYFWVGPRRQMRLVGFDRFLNRCVKHLPRTQQQWVFKDLSAMSDEDGIARFVDEMLSVLQNAPGGDEDSINLKVGASWMQQQQVMGPMPMTLQTEYTVKTLSETESQIDIRGTVGPAFPVSSPGPQGENMIVTVRGGRTFGQCTVNRKTGLPTHSQVERFIDMQVQLAGGRRFEQRKRIVTTIEPLPPATAGQESAKIPPSDLQAATDRLPRAPAEGASRQ